jgi:hypothetical protein
MLDAGLFALPHSGLQSKPKVDHLPQPFYAERFADHKIVAGSMRLPSAEGFVHLVNSLNEMVRYEREEKPAEHRKAILSLRLVRAVDELAEILPEYIALQRANSDSNPHEACAAILVRHESYCENKAADTEASAVRNRWLLINLMLNPSSHEEISIKWGDSGPLPSSTDKLAQLETLHAAIQNVSRHPFGLPRAASERSQVARWHDYA